MDQQTLNVLNGVLRVIFYSLYIAGPIMILLSIMYLYQRYAKYREKEIKEAERIIVKKNEQIVADALTINKLTEQKKELSADVFDLEKRKRDLSHELKINVPEDEVSETEQVDYASMPITALQALAKERGLKRYSRLSKADLIKMLG